MNEPVLAPSGNRVPAAGTCAQTNLQLYRQLSDLEYPESVLVSVARAYDLSGRLFAGLHRASGKPFVAHLVGTASVLAPARPQAPVLLAALLHAAYANGDFGDRQGAPGRTDARAEVVRAAAGAEAEELVARYMTMPWPPDVRSASAAADGIDRQVVLLRLANEAEELVDLGILFHGDGDLRRERALAALPGWIALAEAISAPHVASALAREFGLLETEQSRQALRSDRLRSFRPQPPLSPGGARRRPGGVPVILARLAHALRRTLKR